MIHITRWQIIFIVAVCVMSILYSAPNLLKPELRSKLEAMGSWAPSKTVNLGLDLQGGSHLLLEVEVDTVLHERTEDLVNSARPELRKEKIAYTRIASIPGGMRLTLKDANDGETARKILRKMDDDLDVVAVDATTIEAKYTEMAIKKVRDQTIDQSIEIVRRRIDETGTREPAIQRQGEDRIIVQLPGVENPERIKEILGKTAKLTFHLVDMGTGASPGGNRVLPMAEDPAQTISIQRRAMLTGDMLVNAQPTFDQQTGRPVVSFRLNGIGAKKFCDVTRDNVNKPFAIVLDDKVISAPRINGAICGGNAIITGQFSVQETTDLSLLLRAGALPAPLKILEERTVGPSLGSDSVKAGKKACLMALLFVMIFACASYGLFGIFASVGLLFNMTLIMAIMSMLQATLTLPGIAGIVLTIGLAIDGNVLVFERIKEELRAGRGIMAAIDTGYVRARTTITDSNLTALIAALILFSFGTGPIKGFAVTMCIGVVTSYFCALMLTRMIIITWLRAKKPKEITV